MSEQDTFRAWAAKRLDEPAESIDRVEFETWTGGYCETCEYETFGARVYLEGERKPVEIEGDAAAIIRELLAIQTAQLLDPS